MDFIKLLQQELTPALGCTEPGAIALASAKAAEQLNASVEKLDIYLSRNMMKNAMNVGIAGTNETGGAMAAALGAVAGKSKYGLECLRDITPRDTKAAMQLLKENKVSILLDNSQEKIYVKAVAYAAGREAAVTIKHSHDTITEICVDDKELYQAQTVKENGTAENEQEEFCFRDILEFVQAVPAEKLDFLWEAVTYNEVLVKEGLSKSYGLAVGKKLYRRIDENNKQAYIRDYLVSATAAAVDARMAGCKYPVMSLNGSGNQGITATVPVFTFGAMEKLPREKILRALALSELVTLYIKKYIGKLSALCACTVASSVGVSCAVVYLYGGGYKQMVCAVKNMIADISGLICDGAKSTCALKIATGVTCALQSAYLAMTGEEGLEQAEGIIDEEIDNTVKNLGRVATEGMTPTDNVILDIMVCKGTNRQETMDDNREKEPVCTAEMR